MTADSTCSLCKEGESETNGYGILVTCSACNLCIHVECYGVDDEAAALALTNQWKCDTCAAGFVDTPSCNLCLRVFNSPMVPVVKNEDGKKKKGEFVHLLCALSNFDVSVSFGDKGKRGVDLSKIPLKRRNLVCKFCKKKGGGAIQCQVNDRFDRKYAHNPPSTNQLENTVAKGVKRKCFTSFHPTCGILNSGEFFFSAEGIATCSCPEHSHPDVVTLLRYGTLDSSGVQIAGTANQRLMDSNHIIEKRCLSRSVHTARFYKENQAIIAPFYTEGHRDAASKHWTRLCSVDPEAVANGVQPPRIDMGGRQPDFINGTMKDYQIIGLQWLLDLDATIAGGILADEMGLGKTIQTCSFLGQLHASADGARGPHLVVCPLSVLDTWRTELARWTPGLRVAVFYSNEEGRKSMKESELVTGEFDVCVTTYEMCVAEHSYLVRRLFDWIVLDEGAKIKGADTFVSSAVRSLRSYGRLILTGTPLQNNMDELWPLLNFILPAGFPESHTRAAFTSAFMWAEKEDNGRLVNASTFNKGLVEAAQAILSKVMLRRTKASIHLDIPEKIEKRIFLPMTPVQVGVYKQLLQKDAGLLSLMGKNHGGSASELSKLNNLAIQLRKCTGHPFIIKGVEPPNCTAEMLINASSKLIFLDKLLPVIKSKGEKVVIFSSFTTILDCVEDFLNERKYLFYRLDGGTASALRTFQTTNFAKPGTQRFIFLVSTRAGGLGLNLQAANNAVFLDSDWNPAADLQAQMRVHRIGQTRKVTIYRLVCKSTIEERILAVMQEKQSFADLVIDESDDNLGQQNVSSSVLKEAVLCGAASVLNRTSLQITADFGQFLKASLEDLVEGTSKLTKVEDDDKNLNVDTRLFEGVRTERGKYKDISEEMASKVTDVKRKRVSTVEMHYGGVGVGQIAVSKESLEQERHNLALFEAAAARRKAKDMNKATPIKHYSECCIGSCPLRAAGSGSEVKKLTKALGKLELCGRCPVAWHPTCAYQEGLDATMSFTGQLSCFAHRCHTCRKSASEAAGALFRCVTCHRTVCQDDIDHDASLPADDTGNSAHLDQLRDIVDRNWKIARNLQFISCGCKHGQDEPTPAKKIKVESPVKAALSPAKDGMMAHRPPAVAEAPIKAEIAGQ